MTRPIAIRTQNHTMIRFVFSFSLATFVGHVHAERLIIRKSLLINISLK